MNYTWNVIQIGKRDVTNINGDVLTDAVVYVEWQKTATDTDGTIAHCTGKTDLDLSNTGVGDFIAFESVTKDNLITWVEAALGGQTQAINKTLNKKLDAKRTTTSTFDG